LDIGEDGLFAVTVRGEVLDHVGQEAASFAPSILTFRVEERVFRGDSVTLPGHLGCYQKATGFHCHSGNFTSVHFSSSFPNQLIAIELLSRGTEPLVMVRGTERLAMAPVAFGGLGCLEKMSGPRVLWSGNKDPFIAGDWAHGMLIHTHDQDGTSPFWGQVGEGMRFGAPLPLGLMDPPLAASEHVTGGGGEEVLLVSDYRVVLVGF
jgi:hypothetical protein